MRQYELIEKVKSYDPTADEGLLNRAYVYAMRMHGSQKRASGDPYFAHPIEVAGILTDYHLDTATIVTGLLHDVIEDTEVTREEVARLFGEEVAELVEGVTKLSRLETTADYKRQAENLRKFILAVSKDVRVLLVKLADRLHNMRTLQFIRNPAKRERIARETLDIYAPLARSIGCHRICSELEELAFTHLHPVARDAIIRRLDALRAGQGRAVALASEEIVAKLEAEGIAARVVGREKGPFSIWRKLQRKSLGFAQLSDIYAFRVIVDSEDDCYRALGVIHRAWPNVPERFKDFISTPKRNNYRSIHTTVVGPRAMRIEMQIRTEAMDRVAEQGVAAHWRYKNETYAFDPEAAAEAAAGGSDPLANLRQLVQVLEQGGDAEDLLEHAKLEMFLDQVFVFTPKGKLISLPHGVAERRCRRCRARRQDRAAAGLEEPDGDRPGQIGDPPSYPPFGAGRISAPGPRLPRADIRARRQTHGRCFPAPGSRPVCRRQRGRFPGRRRPRPDRAGPGAGGALSRPQGNRKGGGFGAPADRGRQGRAVLCPRRRPHRRRQPALRVMLQPDAGGPDRRYRRGGKGPHHPRH